MFKKLISSIQLGRDNFRRWLGLKLFDRSQMQPADSRSIQKIVFLRWDAKWGDAIVSSFVFPALRRTYPDIRIEVVTTTEMSALFSDYFGIDNVHQIKKRPKYSALKALAERLGKVDVLVHLSPRMKMKDLYFLKQVNASVVAGLDDDVNFVNLKLGKKTSSLHFADKFRALLSGLGVSQTDNISYQVPINPDSIERVKAFVADTKSVQLIAFNPFGSGGSRKLSAESIRKALQILTRQFEHAHIVLLHSPETINTVEVVCESNEFNNVIYHQDCRSIYDAIAMIKCADAVISVDTAIVHIATGLKKPVMGLYNPDKDNYAAWHPNQNNAETVFAKYAEPADINLLDWREFDLAAARLSNQLRSATEL